MVQVVSVHLPKTAGTSFGRALSQAFADDVLYDYADKPINTAENSRIKSALEHNKQQPWIKQAVVHGHFLPAKYQYLAQSESVKFVTWLRDPIDRLKSHYCFWRDTQPPAIIPPLRQRMIDEDWSFYEFSTEPALLNMYHQFFAGFSVERFDFIGLMERYEQDIQLCSAMLGVTLGFTRENTRKRQHDLELTKRELEHIRQMHKQDVELYEKLMLR